MENTEKTSLKNNIVEVATKGGIIAVLAYIVMFFGQNYMSKIDETHKELVQIRLELTKIQSQLLSKDEIKESIDNAVLLHEAKYHYIEGINRNEKNYNQIDH